MRILVTSERAKLLLAIFIVTSIIAIGHTLKTNIYFFLQLKILSLTVVTRDNPQRGEELDQVCAVRGEEWLREQRAQHLRAGRRVFRGGQYGRETHRGLRQV